MNGHVPRRRTSGSRSELNGSYCYPLQVTVESTPDDLLCLCTIDNGDLIVNVICSFINLLSYKTDYVTGVGICREKLYKLFVR